MLTTDEFINEVNQLTTAYAIKSQIYGIDIYETFQDFRDDDREVNWFMTVDPKATSMAQPFGDNFVQWPDEWNDSQREKLADLIEEYINTPVEFRMTRVDRDNLESIRKRLMGYFNDFDYGEEYRNGRLDGALGVLSDLGLEKEYRAAKESYKVKQQRTVNE